MKKIKKTTQNISPSKNELIIIFVCQLSNKAMFFEEINIHNFYHTLCFQGENSTEFRI